MPQCARCDQHLETQHRFCSACGHRAGGPAELTRTCSLLATGILAIWVGLLAMAYASQWALSEWAVLYFPFLVLAAVGCAGPALRRAGTRWGAANILTLLLLVLVVGLSAVDWSYITTGVALVAAVLHVTGIVAARPETPSPTATPHAVRETAERRLPH